MKQRIKFAAVVALLLLLVTFWLSRFHTHAYDSEESLRRPLDHHHVYTRTDHHNYTHNFTHNYTHSFTHNYTHNYTRPETIKQGEALFGLGFERATLVSEDWQAHSAQQLAGALFFCREELTRLLLPAATAAPEVETKNATIIAENVTQDWPSGGYLCPGDKWQVLQSNVIKDSEAHRTWSLQICLHGNGLRGVIRAKKQEGVCAEPLNMQSNAFHTANHVWNARADAIFGPEEFIWFLEGYELQDLTSAQRHLGQCHYETSFQVKIPGKYRLQMLWTRTAHLATRETEEWPDAFVAYPLGSKTGVFLDLGSEDEQKQVRERVMAGHDLPVCSKRNAAGVGGRWVFSKSGPLEFRERPVPGRRERFVTFVNAEDYVWVPHKCKLLQLRDYVDKCQVDRLAVFGDSHGRLFFQGLLVELCGIGEDILAGYSRSPWQHMRFNFTKCPGFSKALEWNYYSIFNAQGFESEVMRLFQQQEHEKEYVLANFGQHILQQPSSYAGRYEPNIRHAVTALAQQQLLQSNITDRFVWYQTPIYPYDSGGFVRSYRDGRTVARVVLYNSFMDDALEEAGVRIAPLLHLTAPLYTSFTDRAHFPRWIYMHSARVALSNFC